MLLLKSLFIILERQDDITHLTLADLTKTKRTECGCKLNQVCLGLLFHVLHTDVKEQEHSKILI